MTELKALIFDVDGTLADTEKDGHRVAFNLAFEQAGLDWDWSVTLYGKLLKVTGGKERIRYYLDEFNREFSQPDNLDDFIADLHKSKTAFYTQMLSEGVIPLRQGVKRLIHEARESGMRLAIATTTTPANVSALLVHALDENSEGWFEVIAAGDIVPAKKPAADIYEFVLKEMGLQANECLAFEDSYNGICSSTGADLPTIITVNEYTQDDDFSGAAIVLDNMGDPDNKFNVIDGFTPEEMFLNLKTLKQIHQQAIT
ncbi:MAG: HAD family hydrolase [Gammaproteobacteria bacterium]|nr:HAD family hydrolase [Gammaproteobacteria bacterium]